MSKNVTEETGNKRIWTIGSGKGGTGKSLVSAGLGIVLSKMGRKVVLIDADLGASNLHTCLGVKKTKSDFVIFDFIDKRVKSIEDVAIETPFKNLRLISGAKDSFAKANPLYSQKMRLLRHIKKLECDDIIIDVGAGTSYNVLDFFILSDTGIIVVLPELTAIENMYRFIENAILRIIRRYMNREEFQEFFKYIVENKKESKNLGELLKNYKGPDNRTYVEIREVLQKFKPALIINQVREKDDIQIGSFVKRLLDRHLGVKASYAGHIPYDPFVYRSIKKFEPLLTTYPDSPASVNIRRIARKLIG